MDSIRKLFCFLALVCLLPHHAQCQGETIEGVNDFNLVISDQRVPLGEIGNLTISVNYTGALREPNYDLRLKFYQPENDEKASYIVLEEDNLYFSSHCIMHGTLKNITVRGVYLGFSTILVNATKIPKQGGPRLSFEVANKPFVLPEINVAIVQTSRTLVRIFTYVIMVMVILNTINMGCALDLQVVKECFKKPIGPAVGALSQFIVMPLLSYGIGYAMFDDPMFRLGLFVLGCCPGGNGSNFWCILLRADINLSITMTFCSTILALGMMPLWMFALGRSIVESANMSNELKIPYFRILVTLAALIGPVLIGILVKNKWKKGAQILTRIIVPFTLLLVLIMLTFGIYSYWNIMKLMTGWMVFAGFAVAISGYLIGAGLAAIFRLPLKQIIAVSVETAFQNGQIALILLQTSFQPPFNDVATIAPIAQLTITGIPLWLLYFAYKIYLKVSTGSCSGAPGEVEVKVEVQVEEQKAQSPESAEESHMPMLQRKLNP